MSLKLYYDLMSQPSRALYIFLKVTEIPFQSCLVDLKNAEHLNEDFKEKNRFQKVPFIHDGNFKLSESIAIVRYLSKKYKLNNKWYPQELQAQAKVDEYLEWQHNNTRIFCAMYFQKKWLIPLLTGQEPNPKTVETWKQSMLDCLDKIENIWLANKQPFLCGNEISVADIFAACEIEQPRMAGFDAREGRPLLSAWLDRVRQNTNPYYDEAHRILNKIAQTTAHNELKSKM